jgi:hypothetical protein
MQYFPGYSSFTSDKLFDVSLFADIRKQLGFEIINEINEKIVSLKTKMVSGKGAKQEGGKITIPLAACGWILKAKPLGRPSALSIHVSPGERNPIEGKFGQTKTTYGLGRIKARLKETSESWIAGIFMVPQELFFAGRSLKILTYIGMRAFSG